MHYQRIHFGYEGQRTSCRNWPMRDWIEVIWKKLIERITQEKAPGQEGSVTIEKPRGKTCSEGQKTQAREMAVELEWWTGLKQGDSGSDDRESVYPKDGGGHWKGFRREVTWSLEKQKMLKRLQKSQDMMLKKETVSGRSQELNRPTSGRWATVETGNTRSSRFENMSSVQF